MCCKRENGVEKKVRREDYKVMVEASVYLRGLNSIIRGIR